VNPKPENHSAFPLLFLDPSLREIPPVVLRAAERIAGRAIEYATRELGDPAVAVTLLEKAADRVSRVLKNTPSFEVQLRDLDAYLFRAFLRNLNALRRNELRLAERIHEASRNQASPSADLDLKIFLDELLARCEPVTKAVLISRAEGYSWEEIGRHFGMKADTARQKARRALQLVRKFAVGSKKSSETTTPFASERRNHARTNLLGEKT
jgi:DNA-directed RNA polymerase specialized sigma24 family protein